MPSPPPPSSSSSLSSSSPLLSASPLPVPMLTPSPSEAHRLGRTIAGLRRANGWSQRRLAEAAGVSHGYIALLELGRLPSPGKFRLDAVARALNLRTADALLAPALPLPELLPRGVENPRQAVDSAQPVTNLVGNVVGSLEHLRTPA